MCSSDLQREAEVPGEKQTPSAPEDQAEEGQEEYRGNERVIFNADGDACYQGWGESCTDPEDDLYGDEDEDVVYDPGADLTEIPGLPEEDHEEVPPSRKIRFSTAPMMVSDTMVSVTRPSAGVSSPGPRGPPSCMCPDWTPLPWGVPFGYGTADSHAGSLCWLTCWAELCAFEGALLFVGPKECVMSVS